MDSKEHTALIVVDMQPDFMPGGSLAVAEGDQLIDPVRALMQSEIFGACIATQDWHPPNHVSFASNHPGHTPMDVIDLYGHEQVLWPDHCVQTTPGAELHPQLPWSRVTAVIRKGSDPAVDSYSGMRNNWDSQGRRPPTGLAGYLRDRSVTDLVLCGLARDYCVKWTAEDAAQESFKVRVVWDLTRPVDRSSDQRVRSDLEQLGIGIVSAADLLA